MASYKRRQCSDNNQSVQETENVPETHAYQEKHFQPTLNAPVPEGHPDTEYGSTVTPDKISSRDDKSPRSTFTESSDQPGEDDIFDATIRQDLQGNSDPGMHYSTPDVSSGVLTDPGGFSGFETGTVAASASASSAAGTVVASSFATSSAAAAISSAAVATAGTVLIAATIILPLVIGVPSAIIFDEISVTDTTVYYTIYFEDYEEDMDLTVSLHNIFTDRSHAVEGHSISVLEENLKPGMEYQLTVYGSMGTVLDERTVKTSEESAHPELDVTVAEFSKSDGLIHLSAELDDPNGKCSDFRAVFYDETDKKHTEVRSVSISNFDSEITMDVGLASDTSVDGTFTVECIIDGENAVLYEKSMTVYGTPYFAFAAEPTITDGSMTINCVIIDPESVRTDYHVMFFIQDDTDYSGYYDDDGVLINGSYTVTGIPSYTYYSSFLKLTWEEGGGTKGRIVEGKNYDTPVTIDVDGIELTDSGGEFVLNVPVTVSDPLGGWGELTIILGNSVYTSSTYGYASVVTFTGTGTVTVPVDEFGLYGLSLPITVKKAGGAELLSLPAMVIGPTMTVGKASMNHVSETIGGYTYETRFDVEINDFVDDLHYLTDESGDWKAIMPVLTATKISQDMTAIRVTHTGDGRYLASFYSDDWVLDTTERDEDTFTLLGYTKAYQMAYVDDSTYEVYSKRDSSGNISATFTVATSETVTNAIAMSGSTEITGTVTNPDTNRYKITLDLTGADPYSYKVYLYNGTTLLQSYIDTVAPYPKLIEGSAVYNRGTGEATVRFEYTPTPVYMPDYYVPGVTDDGILTLTFSVDESSPVLTGDGYFRFLISDKNSEYYWYTTFTIT